MSDSTVKSQLNLPVFFQILASTIYEPHLWTRIAAKTLKQCLKSLIRTQECYLPKSQMQSILKDTISDKWKVSKGNKKDGLTFVLGCFPDVDLHSKNVFKLAILESILVSKRPRTCFLFWQLTRVRHSKLATRFSVAHETVSKIIMPNVFNWWSMMHNAPYIEEILMLINNV